MLPKLAQRTFHLDHVRLAARRREEEGRPQRGIPWITLRGTQVRLRLPQAARTARPLRTRPCQSSNRPPAPIQWRLAARAGGCDRARGPPSAAGPRRCPEGRGLPADGTRAPWIPAGRAEAQPPCVAGSQAHVARGLFTFGRCAGASLKRGRPPNGDTPTWRPGRRFPNHHKVGCTKRA